MAACILQMEKSFKAI